MFWNRKKRQQAKTRAKIDATADSAFEVVGGLFEILTIIAIWDD